MVLIDTARSNGRRARCATAPEAAGKPGFGRAPLAYAEDARQLDHDHSGLLLDGAGWGCQTAPSSDKERMVGEGKGTRGILRAATENDTETASVHPEAPRHLWHPDRRERLRHACSARDGGGAHEQRRVENPGTDNVRDGRSRMATTSVRKRGVGIVIATGGLGRMSGKTCAGRGNGSKWGAGTQLP